jgi:hypothetical protein
MVGVLCDSSIVPAEDVSAMRHTAYQQQLAHSQIKGEELGTDVPGI